MQNIQNMLSKRWKKQIRRDARSIYCYNYQTSCSWVPKQMADRWPVILMYGVENI